MVSTHVHVLALAVRTLVWSVGLSTFFSPSTIYILFPYSFRILVQNRVYILEYDKNTAPNTIGILTLGHGWWWSPGGVGTWAVSPSISAICAKRAISARSSPWPRAAVPTRVFGPPPSTELTTITYARFIVCATRSTTTAVAPRAPFQHAAMAVCSTSRHGFLRRVEARRAGT